MSNLFIKNWYYEIQLWESNYGSISDWRKIYQHLRPTPLNSILMSDMCIYEGSLDNCKCWNIYYRMYRYLSMWYHQIPITNFLELIALYWQALTLWKAIYLYIFDCEWRDVMISKCKILMMKGDSNGAFPYFSLRFLFFLYRFSIFFKKVFLKSVLLFLTLENEFRQDEEAANGDVL